MPPAEQWTPLPAATPGADIHPAATAGVPRYLDEHQLRLLFAESGKQVRGHLALLLSGISPYELPLLHPASFDAARHTIDIGGANRRSLSIDERVWPIVALVAEQHDERRLSVADLDARLCQSAQDVGLAEPASVSALAVWHSYQVEMMQRGVDIDQLQQWVGRLVPEQRAVLVETVPPDIVRPVEPDWPHPALLH